MEYNVPFFSTLMRLAVLQRESVSRTALQEAVKASASATNPREALAVVSRTLHVKSARWVNRPDASNLPALAVNDTGEWAILRGRNGMGVWILDRHDSESNTWVEYLLEEAATKAWKFCVVRLAAPYRASSSPILKETVNLMFARSGLFLEAAAGGLLLAIIGILVSFYSMQVYDRVIPAAAFQTLLVLTIGVIIAIVVEYIAKVLRSRLYERLINQIDGTLARSVYLRFLSVRLDQLPNSVGSLANQLRGYESVRAFLIMATGHLIVDAPFALVFVAIVGAIAGPLLFIPLAFFCISITIGLLRAKKISLLAQRSQQFANMKTGLLVESVEGAETIKSGQGGWRMLNRWIMSADEARDVDLEMRHINENGQYLAMMLQQIAYISLVAVGAWMASNSLLTLGGLIACSILSGRILAPVTQLGLLISSWANTRAALRGLDGLWALEDDHFGVAEPLLLENIRGHYRFDNVTFSFRGKPAMQVGDLRIAPGEKIAVIGPVGAGKTTLLRMLSGMYRPSEGRILLDDADISHLSKPLLSEKIGFLQQEGRLLSGTLRENLILGLLDPGDEAILAVAKKTGLYDSVLADHPDGMNQQISEGGTGLSNGQRQLVNITRVFLRAPNIWLLDEPTASLDTNSELAIRKAIREELTENTTLVLITHRLDFLQVVDRVIVVANHKIVMDGPRDRILQQIAGPVVKHSVA